MAAFDEAKSNFVGGGGTTSTTFGPISESRIAEESQDISGSVGQKESMLGSWKLNIHQAVRVREGAASTMTGAAYGPSNLGGRGKKPHQKIDS